MNFRNWLITEWGMAQSFLMSILENLDDQHNYMVFADWLEENGMDSISQFIRASFDKSPEASQIIEKVLPDIRQLVKPYNWERVVRTRYHIEIPANQDDKNSRYDFYFKDLNMKYAIGSMTTKEVKIPSKIIISQPRKGYEGKWEVPYVGSIVKDPPENLLYAMVLGNLLNVRRNV